MPKLIDVVVNPFAFIFDKEFTSEPWYFAQMDFMYLMQHSGDRTTAPIIDNLLKLQANHEKLDDGSVGTLAVSIRAIYGNGWARQYKALTAEYNPIENYDSTEERTPEITHEHKHGHTIDTTARGNGTTGANTYGFNSSTAAPAAASVADSYNQDTETHSGTDTETERGKETVKRHGNIGVTTNQQMIQAELDLRKQNFIESVVFRDVDEFLTLAYYD